jgi:hypothetical protein
MTDDSIDTIDPGPAGWDFSEEAALNFDQIRVERLVSDLRNNIAELATIRLAANTAHLLLAEEVSLGSALTALQMLLSHMAANKPMLRVVK